MSPKAAAKARIWTIGAIIVSLLILLLGGVFGVKPLWEEAGETNEIAEDQEARNDNEQIQVNKLRQQFAKIDDYREVLTELREQVPTEIATQEFQRQFDTIVEDYGVTLNTLQFGSASLVTITNREADLIARGVTAEARGGLDADKEDAPPAAANDEEGSDADDSGASSAKVEDNSGRPRFSDFYTLEIKFELAGDYYDILNVMRALQTTDRRTVIITSVSGGSGSSGPDDDDTDGLSLSVTGLLGILLDPETETSTLDDENVERPELPSTKGNKNPLVNDRS